MAANQAVFNATMVNDDAAAITADFEKGNNTLLITTQYYIGSTN